MDDQMMTIREMCDAFNVTPRTLRFYEAKELLFPKRVGQKRLFTGRDRARLKLILRGKGFGFSLEEIRQILDLYALDDQGHTQIREARQIGRRRLAELEAEAARVEKSIGELKVFLEWADTVLDNPGLAQAAE